MTHEILQTDIDLAIKLRNDQRPDEEIIQALVHRRVDPTQAAQLVDDLRNGRRVRVEPAAPPEFTATRRSRSKSRSRDGQTTDRSAPSDSETILRPEPSRHSPKKSPLVRVLVVATVLLALVLVAVVWFQQHRREQSVSESTPGKTTPPAADRTPRAAPVKAAQPGTGKSTSVLVLELQPDGLRMGGSRVSAENVLAVATNLLGRPSRTNQLGQAGATVYAYDSHGLLIYSQKAGGTNSIVLDCEATGAPNGTESPFAGVLKVEDQVIALNTDSEALGRFGKLGLRKPNAGATVWSGRYQNLDLVFAYLKSPGHLSLIEIDLK